MTKTAKITTAVSVCVVVLAVVFGCLFGIKCQITLDYGYTVKSTDSLDGLWSLNISNDTVPKNDVVVRFTKYAPERPKRGGYIFEGWYKDTACTIPWDNSMVTGDMTLYAKWKAV